MKIALLQLKDYGSVDANWRETESAIREAAMAGAQCIATQELFLSSYFCRTQNEENFLLAEEVPGSSTIRLENLAKEFNVVIIASLFEKAMEGLFYNTLVCIDADGSYLGKYRKKHIPQDPYFEEKFYFAPGDTPYQVWRTQYGSIGALICWDQWFPEAARLLALQGAEVIFVPTAIGWLPAEREVNCEAERVAWQNVQKGHAVANSVYFAAINRVGVEAPIDFWGRSFVSDYYGQLIAEGGETEEIIYADCDLVSLRQHRRTWPFFRDRRIDSYDDLTKRSF